MIDQLVADGEKALARDAEDRAAQVGEVQVRDANHLRLEIADWSAAHPDVQRRRGDADAFVEHEFPDRVEGAEIRDDPAIGASLLAAETRDGERLLPRDTLVRRDHLDAGQLVAIDLQQADAGAVVLADDFRFELLAAGHRDDHVFRAEQQVMDGEDQAVGADDGAGAAAVGAEANRGRNVRRRDMRVNADGGAQNFLEQEWRCVHGDILRIRLGPRTCGFKRDRSAKKNRRSLARPPQVINFDWCYFALFAGASGIAVSFARIESVCSASPRSSSLYF